MDSIILGYSGVHQIIQLALAAQEMGELESLHCSLLDAPGKLGWLIAKVMKSPSASPLGGAALNPQKVHEFSAPFLMGKIAGRLFPRHSGEQLGANQWFDAHVARIIRRSAARLFVGAESCALLSFQAARKKGVRCILDCPGISAAFLDEQARKAAVEFHLDIEPSSNSPQMQQRKRDELELADRIFCCSELQKSHLVSEGVPVERIRLNPLWTHVGFWGQYADPQTRLARTGPLRVLYAGSISLRKGVPYLLEATQKLHRDVTVTLAGSIAPDMKTFLSKYRVNQTYPYLPKEKLRELFQAHDVLVMPTLGDSFGFVVLEAMAAGLPVIATSHCGAPLPDESWRVQAASAEAIAGRLRYYLDQPDRLAADGALGAGFAAQFTPARFRERACGFFGELLTPPA
jgi:glycosyltransferase involved in cell wall biosynthesis